MATALMPAPCRGPGHGNTGVRIPAGVGGRALACRVCDGTHLTTSDLLPRPAEGYDRSGFTDGTR